MDNRTIEHSCAFTGHRPERLAIPEADVILWLNEQVIIHHVVRGLYLRQRDRGSDKARIRDKLLRKASCGKRFEGRSASTIFDIPALHCCLQTACR